MATVIVATTLSACGGGGQAPVTQTQTQTPGTGASGDSGKSVGSPTVTPNGGGTADTGAAAGGRSAGPAGQPPRWWHDTALVALDAVETITVKGTRPLGDGGKADQDRFTVSGEYRGSTFRVTSRSRKHGTLDIVKIKGTVWLKADQQALEEREPFGSNPPAGVVAGRWLRTPARDVSGIVTPYVPRVVVRGPFNTEPHRREFTTAEVVVHEKTPSVLLRTLLPGGGQGAAILDSSNLHLRAFEIPARGLARQRYDVSRWNTTLLPGPPPGKAVVIDKFG